jgi:hypothetical protein
VLAGLDVEAITEWEEGDSEPAWSELGLAIAACQSAASGTLDSKPTVDRSQLRQSLAMTPEQRLAAVANVSRVRATRRRGS